MEPSYSIEVKERIATLSTGRSGFTLELTRTGFNGRAAKLDLRRWSNGQPLRGVSLTEDEGQALLRALAGVYPDTLAEMAASPASSTSPDHDDSQRESTSATSTETVST